MASVADLAGVSRVVRFGERRCQEDGEPVVPVQVVCRRLKEGVCDIRHVGDEHSQVLCLQTNRNCGVSTERARVTCTCKVYQPCHATLDYNLSVLVHLPMARGQATLTGM